MFPLIGLTYRARVSLAISKNVARSVPIIGTNDTVFAHVYILFEQLKLILLSVAGRVWVQMADMTAQVAALATFIADQELE